MIRLVEEKLSCRSLKRSFYRQGTELVARRLLGKALVFNLGNGKRGKIVGGIIVETEAYLPANDAACHAFRGRTKRNQVMFEQGGHLYVYTIHTRHCLNVVTEDAGQGCAVLIRAIQPVWGLNSMLQNRPGSLENLTNGPGKTCQALGIDLDLNGEDLVQSNVASIVPIEDRLPSFEVVSTPRIGISQATDRKLRFFVDRNRFVSGLRKFHSGRANLEFEV